MSSAPQQPPGLFENTSRSKRERKAKRLKALGISVAAITIGVIILVNLPRGGKKDPPELNIPASNFSHFSQEETPSTEEEFPSAPAPPGAWMPLLTEGLPAWSPWLGSPHPSVNLPDSPAVENGPKRPAVGPSDPIGVFSLVQENGEDVLKISGEIPGGLITNDSFKNYHLYTQFRLSNKRWPSTAPGDRDSGILIHSHGLPGSLYEYWMKSLEYQLRRGISGSVWFLGTSGKTPFKNHIGGNGGPIKRFHPQSPLTPNKNFLYRPESVRESSSWNTAEILTIGTTSVFMLNGSITAIVTDLKKSTQSRAPLRAGRILLQSAGAETFFQDMRIRNISGFPPELQRAINKLK